MAPPRPLCEGCRDKDQLIVDLQHEIRELRHQLENERVARHQPWTLKGNCR